MPIMKRRVRVAAPAAGMALVALATSAASCNRSGEGTLTGLCDGHATVLRVDASVDSVLPYAGPALAGLGRRHFALRMTFSPPAATGPTAGTAECNGAMGDASFTGDLPEPIRGGASSTGTAGWRIDGDTIILDLNPRARDNNLVMSLPTRGGRGHWALSTFAGEAVRGETTSGQ